MPIPARSLLALAAALILVLSGCDSESTPDAGSDGGQSCNCCGTEVAAGPGQSCLSGICDPYCGIAPDAGRDAGSRDAGSSDAGSDAGSSDAGSSDAGSSDAGSDAGSSDAGSDASALLPVGTPDCTSDAQCASGICWNFADYDSLCGGRICSTTCSTHTDCIDAATSAGASSASSATCGTDGRCDFVGTGLGAFFCA